MHLPMIFKPKKKRINLAWSNFDVNCCKLSSLNYFKIRVVNICDFLIRAFKWSNQKKCWKSASMPFSFCMWNDSMKWNKMEWLFFLACIRQNSINEVFLHKTTSISLNCKQMSMNSHMKCGKILLHLVTI